MSGQDILTAVGAVAGFVLTGGTPLGAIKGALIGNAIGGALFPQKIERVIPGLQDKKINAGDYGYQIPFGYGTFKTNAWMLWGQDLYEQAVTTTEGGKGGGPEVSTTNYNTFFRGAFLLCEGPVTAISKIWIDDVLKFDISSSNTGAIVPGSEFTFRGTITPTLVYQGATWKFYLGAEDQLPDPMMESYLGVGNVPAYRGICYVTVNNLFLDPYGKRLPNITFEVVKNGTVQDQKVTITLDPYQLDPGEPLEYLESIGPLYVPHTGYIVSILKTAWSTSGGITADEGLQLQCIHPVTGATIYSVGLSLGGLGDWALAKACFDSGTGFIWYKNYAGFAAINMTNGNIVIPYVAVNSYPSTSTIAVNSANDELWVSQIANYIVLDRTAILSGSNASQALLYSIPNYSATYHVGVAGHIREIQHRQWMLFQAHNNSPEFWILDNNGSHISGPFLVPSQNGSFATASIDANNDCIWIIGGDAAFNLHRYDLASLGFGAVYTCGSYHYPGFLRETSEIIYYYNPTKELRFATKDNVVNSTIDISADVVNFGVPTYITWNPAFQTVSLMHVGGLKRISIYSRDRVTGSGILISDMVQDISTRVGIDANDLQVSALTDTVPGYSIDVRTQARACIDPLRSAFPFDLVGEDGKIRAKKRGQSSVMTISYGDLVLDESTNARPYDISHADHIDVASAVDVIYSDTALNYERNVQRAKRHTVVSREITQMVLPLAITADTAIRAGEVALYSAWAARDQWTLNAARKHWELNVGDAFTFVDEAGISRRMLCTKRELLGLTRLRIEAVLDDATVYTSTVTGAGAWTPPNIAVTLQKRLELLDIPILKDSDDFPGFYAVGTVGTSSANLYESIDNGMTYSLLGTLQEAALGYSTTTLGNFTAGNVWDITNVVRVVVDAGELVSVTDAQVLAGLNAALIGREIIQYATATLVGTGTYDLSRLLRGRRGTEWAISLHNSGEKFIPLPGGLSRINSSARNALRYYKAVKAGDSLTDTTAVAFSNTQVGLKPFSPTYVQGARDGSSNLTISWLRRSRIGSAWGTVIDMPLGEDAESYQIDIMQGSTVKRTINATTPTAAYSATDQTTDFGSPQASILVNIYQISATVGRGTVGIATI